jgi:hypothetical protein
MTATTSLFEKAAKEFPLPFDHLHRKTIADLVFEAETEIDLIEEDQDGTDRADLKPLKKWLKKWKPKA